MIAAEKHQSGISLLGYLSDTAKNEASQMVATMNFRHTELKARIEIIRFCLGLGVAMSTVGFFMWWYKVQRLLDIQLKMEIEEMLPKRVQLAPTQPIENINVPAKK